MRLDGALKDIEKRSEVVSVLEQSFANEEE